MTPQDREIIGKALAVAAEVYDKKISRELMAIWELLIDEDGLPAADVARAIKHHIRTDDWFPRPAQIRRLLRPDRNAKALALESWAAILASFSGGKMPDDPTTQAAVRAVGGRQAIGHYPSDKLEWMQRRYCEAFETITDQTPALLQHNGADRPALGRDS